jgi:type VI secretion system secreted protein Hcp
LLIKDINLEGYMMKTTRLLTSIMFCFIFAAVSFGAETVHLTLTGANQGWIQGDSMQLSLERENTIEAVAYTHMLIGEPDPRNGITGEVRDHFPVTILKRLDKSTPRLFQAWRTHERLEAEFRFFRPNPSGDGTIQQFYKVILHHAYISGIRQEVPNTLDPQTQAFPPVERVSFTYSGIEEIWGPDGFSSGDEWHTNTTKVPLSDLNFDGIVNMNDFVIMADEWMTQY